MFVPNADRLLLRIRSEHHPGSQAFDDPMLIFSSAQIANRFERQAFETPSRNERRSVVHFCSRIHRACLSPRTTAPALGHAAAGTTLCGAEPTEPEGRPESKRRQGARPSAAIPRPALPVTRGFVNRRPGVRILSGAPGRRPPWQRIQEPVVSYRNLDWPELATASVTCTELSAGWRSISLWHGSMPARAGSASTTPGEVFAARYAARRKPRGIAGIRGRIALRRRILRSPSGLRAHAQRACVPRGTVGSNPTLSAIQSAVAETPRATPAEPEKSQRFRGVLAARLLRIRTGDCGFRAGKTAWPVFVSVGNLVGSVSLPIRGSSCSRTRRFATFIAGPRPVQPSEP